MDDRIDAAPGRKARLAGFLYLFTILTGAYASATSGSRSEMANLLSGTCYVGVTLLFYSLFKPVNTSVAALATTLSLVGCFLGPLRIFHVYNSPVDSLVFFGGYCLLIAYLIFRSRFLPRYLGALMMIAGLGWLTFAWPRLANYLSPYNVAPGLLGEGALTMWLLSAGVDEQRWKEQAGLVPAQPSEAAVRF